MANSTRQKAPAAIGDFEVLELVATTSLATVYKGRDPATGELVAIKLASPAILNNPVLVKRFSQEFAMIRGLKHPHLIRARRFGHHADSPYMVLDYVDGMSLGDRIEQSGALPEGEAVRVITQVGEALHFAHQRRVIHRDVKPDNILLSAEGVARLADLGLAKDCESDDFLTRPSVGLGTPNFMAPEQFRDAKNADRRCDVYSLGATLYMAVTGQIPFRARGTLSVLKKKLDNELMPPRTLVQRISPWVESAILRAVNVNPQARHASCQEFIEEVGGRKDQCVPGRAVSPTAVQGRQAGVNEYEKRATVRFRSGKGGVCQPLSGGEDGQCVATLRDISADGVGLVLPRRFEPRTVLCLELSGKEDESQHRQLVRVVRVTTLPGRQWLLGCVFANRLDDAEAQELA